VNTRNTTTRKGVIGVDINSTLPLNSANKEQTVCAKCGARESSETVISDLLAACEMAERMILIGIEFGFIRMPDKDTKDSAHDVLPTLRAAIRKAKGAAQ
jgi:hypothetical protein